MDGRSDRNGCVITKIPYGNNGLISLPFGELITDNKGSQFPQFLTHSIEKAIRVVRDDLFSARQSRNEELGKYSGAFNLPKISERYLRPDIDPETFNIYSCSGYEEKYDEGIALIGGILDGCYKYDPGLAIGDYYFNLARPMVMYAMDKIEMEDPDVIKEMMTRLENRIL